MTERGPAKSRAPCRGRKPPGLFRRGLAMTRRPVCLATRDIRDPDRDDILLARTRGTGSDAVTRAERCFAWRDFPEQAFATGQGMIGLAAEHGDERFDALRAEVLHPDRLAPGFPGTGSGTGGGPRSPTRCSTESCRTPVASVSRADPGASATNRRRSTAATTSEGIRPDGRVHGRLRRRSLRHGPGARSGMPAGKLATALPAEPGSTAPAADRPPASPQRHEGEENGPGTCPGETAQRREASVKCRRNPHAAPGGGYLA